MLISEMFIKNNNIKKYIIKTKRKKNRYKEAGGSRTTTKGKMTNNLCQQNLVTTCDYLRSSGSK